MKTDKQLTDEWYETRGGIPAINEQGEWGWKDLSVQTAEKRLEHSANTGRKVAPASTMK